MIRIEKTKRGQESACFEPTVYDTYKFFGITIGDNMVVCPKCGVVYIYIVYVNIIEKLKKIGLLDKNYKPMCCVCYDKNK